MTCLKLQEFWGLVFWVFFSLAAIYYSHPVVTLALFSHARKEQTVTQPETKETLNSPSELQSFPGGCLSTVRAALQKPPANFGSVI